MNERWTGDVLDVIAAFESRACSIEDVQAKLQSVLTLWEGSTAGPQYDAIDLAENGLEDILHTRLREEQGSAALERLTELRAQLLAART